MELAFLTLIHREVFSFAFLLRLQSTIVVGHIEEEILRLALPIMV